MSYYLIYGIHVIYKNIWKVAVFKGFEINIFITKLLGKSLGTASPKDFSQFIRIYQSLSLDFICTFYQIC